MCSAMAGWGGGGGRAAFTLGAGCWPSYKIARIIISLHSGLVTIYGGKKLRQAGNVCINVTLRCVHVTTVVINK
jgi:hypothetical protein